MSYEIPTTFYSYQDESLAGEIYEVVVVWVDTSRYNMCIP